MKSTTLAAALLASVAAAQQSQTLVEETPVLHGQWEGPYVLPIGAQLASATNEIAHGALLPPPSGSDATRVLFGVVPGLFEIDGVLIGSACGYTDACNPGEPEFPPFENGKYGVTYVWNPSRPTNVEVIPSPYTQTCVTDADQDFFCGGHTFLPDGDLLWIGGTNPILGCSPAGLLFTGHKETWRLDISTSSPTWSPAGSMFDARWYATAIQLPGGLIMAAGHDQAPSSAPQDRYDLFASNGSSGQWLPSSVGTAWPNWLADPVGCDELMLLPLLDYPRLHLLSTGEVMNSNASSGDPHEPNNETTRFLNVVDAQTCSNGEWRWDFDRATTSAGATAEPRVNGNSVHLITWQGADLFTDTVYVIAGAREAMELESECISAHLGDIFATTEKMVGPDVNAAWQSGPSLTYNRVQQNTVILLDGSLLTIGGHGVDVEGTCVARHVPERYRPPEVFDNTNAVWKTMAHQRHARRYHSTAVLLPDGRVVSAGGESSQSFNHPSEHSVEIYSPNYLFKGPRPVLDSVGLNDPHVAPYAHLDQVDLTVHLTDADQSVARVALVKNGAATHAFDMSQRYVELRVIFDVPVTPETPLSRLVRVRMPVDEPMAPNGFYMLTVIDDDDIPSNTRWIRLEEGP